MRSAAMILVLAAPLVAWAGPPPRPAPLTSAQYRRLVAVEQEPQHVAVREVRATYMSDREKSMDFTRASDDFWTVAWTGGVPGGILAVLIAAAPL